MCNTVKCGIFGSLEKELNKLNINIESRVLEVAENSIISVAHTAGNEANQISYHFYLSLISVEKQHLFPFTVYTKLRLWNRSIKTGTKARQRV